MKKEQIDRTQKDLHNLPPDTVRKLIESVDEQEITIFMLKPHTFPFEDSQLDAKTWMNDKISKNGLTVICTNKRYLSPHEICELYVDVLSPEPENDAKWGVGWKKELIEYMASGHVFSFLITGDDARRRVEQLKREIRQLCSDGTIQSKIIRNVAHTPEDGELDINLQILFFEGISND